MPEKISRSPGGTAGSYRTSRYLLILSVLVGLAAVAAGFLGYDQVLLFATFGSAVLAVASLFAYRGGWVADDDVPGVQPPPPPPRKATLVDLSIVAAVGGAVAGALGLADVLLILIAVSATASALSFVGQPR